MLPGESSDVGSVISKAWDVRYPQSPYRTQQEAGPKRHGARWWIGDRLLAVVDRREPVEALARAGNALKEHHVDLQAMARLGSCRSAAIASSGFGAPDLRVAGSFHAAAGPDPPMTQRR